MYRLYTEEFQPLLACDSILSAYSRNDISSLHERNLYELGEDRMLTTLMLQEFHRMQLSFVPEATCWTIVPHTIQILTSQRRRWINSTLHNMCELLKVKTMCGVCLFSMKMVVCFDLVSTFLLPSGCAYLYYIIFDAFRTEDPLGPLQILAFAYVGLMTLPFIFRAQWDYILWFAVFLIGGVPAFYFYLPVYAFWNMDDLSWGKTREVQGGEQPTRLDSPSPVTAATTKEELSQGMCPEGTEVTSSLPGETQSSGGNSSDAAAGEAGLEHNDIVSRQCCCFLVFLLLMIGAAFAIHHSVYDDVLFEHFHAPAPELIAGGEPVPFGGDWATTTFPEQTAAPSPSSGYE